MEISKVDDVRDLESAECQIVDGQGEYLFSLILAGPTHPNTRKHAESEGRSLAHQGKRLGGMQKAMDARTETILTDTELGTQKNVRTLMARTLDWKDVTDSGQPVSYDVKQMQVWYEKHRWLRDQVNEFLGESRNFLTGSSKTSSSSPSSGSD